MTGVPELPEIFRPQWQGLAFDSTTASGRTLACPPAGEQDRYAGPRLIWSRPTCEVNGHVEVALILARFPKDRSCRRSTRKNSLPSGGQNAKTPTSNPRKFRKMGETI